MIQVVNLISVHAVLYQWCKSSICIIPRWGRDRKENLLDVDTCLTLLFTKDEKLWNQFHASLEQIKKLYHYGKIDAFNVNQYSSLHICLYYNIIFIYFLKPEN